MIYIFIILSFSFSLDFSSNLIAERNVKYPITYGLYSAVFPGSGQYSLYKTYQSKIALKRTTLFLGIETISWISAIIFNNKYNSQVSKYRKFESILRNKIFN